MSPFAIDPDNPQKVTVWGDLAEIDNSFSKDRDSLWSYWKDLVKHYLNLGFKGFRCDAAYKVPSELWNYLINETLAMDPDSVFFAETLGCTEEEALALHDAGFHYFFNSSKWWDFQQPWCLEQHEKFGKIAPSISFPESHDTTRLAADTNGNETIQRQRYAFASLFSAGVMMPIGYEYGFRKKLDVVSTRPSDWETAAFDLRDLIKRTNKFKIDKSVLHGEGSLIESTNNPDVLVLQRTTDKAPAEKSWIALNKNHSQHSFIDLTGLLTNHTPYKVYRICRDQAEPTDVLFSDSTLQLEPAELVVILEP
jgi:starch synthase (maltosyl-transferring)